MGFVEDMTKGSLTSVLVGVGAALVAPAVLPALISGLRPLAKALIKGGIQVYDAAKETAAEAEEQLSDLVAEVQAELTEAEKAVAATGGVGAATGGAEVPKKRVRIKKGKDKIDT
jgi:uncharacterized protein (UPF0254 family)